MTTLNQTMTYKQPQKWDDLIAGLDLDTLQQPELKRLAQVKLDYDSTKDNNPHLFFVPNGMQSVFVDTVPPEYNSKTIVTKVFSGGNFSGKTTIGINCVVNMVVPVSKMQYQFANNPYWRSFKRPSSGRIVSDATSIKEKIIPELKKWLPVGSYKTSKRGRDYECYWYFPATKSHFTLMTNDQDTKEFESVELDWCLFDEPTQRDKYTATLTRLRFGGLLMFTLTPLIDAGWMDDAILNKVDNITTFMCTADMEANCKQHGKNGVIEHSIIAKIISELDPYEYEARVKGKSLHLSGVCYPQFDKGRHIARAKNYKERLKKDFIIVNVLDPHDRKPFALGWYLVSLSEPYTCYAIAEYPIEPFEKIRFDNKSITDYVGIINNIEKSIGQSYMRFIDPNYGNRHVRQTEAIQKSVKEELQDFGLYYYDVNDNIDIGHKLVKERLKSNTLFVAPELYNHIYGFSHYRHTIIDPLTSKEKLCDDGKDFMDLVRYLCVSDAWMYNPRIKGKQQQYETKGR